MKNGSWVVVLVAFLVYLNSLGNGFTLDDDVVILNNPALHGSALQLFTMVDNIANSQILPFYRPLTNLTFLMDGRLHGFNPFYIRLVNVLFHCANSYLVYRLAHYLFKNNLHAPLLVGLLFAVHPLHTEGVNFNAGGRITIMACFFVLAAYLVHTRSIARGKISLAVAGAILFLAGLFSKEYALMIAPFIFVLEIPAIRDHTPGARLQACLRLSPYFVAAGIYLTLRWLTLSKLGIQTSILPGVGIKSLESMYITTDFATRMANNLYIIPRYLLIIIQPTALANRYVMPDDLNLLALPLLSAWLFIIGCLGWLFTKGRSAVSMFGLAWLFLFWLPVSGIVFVPGAPLADRFLYAPAIGLWIIVADQIQRLLPKGKHMLQRYCYAAIALVLLVLALLTIRRNLDWKSNFTLQSRFVAQYPENAHAHAGLGKVYYATGTAKDMAAAEAEFDKVIAIEPSFPMIHTYLGNINLNQEKLDKALYHYGQAIKVYPLDKEAHLNRGITLEKLGRPKEAIAEYLQFLSSSDNSINIPGGREHAEKRLRELAQ